MKAYVSIRGSRSPRRVDRDASPSRLLPLGVATPDAYAALCFPDSKGGVVRFELSYSTGPSGIIVVLHEDRPGKERRSAAVGRVSP